jgi:hypothetical protein
MPRAIPLIVLLGLTLPACNERVVIKTITPDPAVVEGGNTPVSTTITEFDHPMRNNKWHAIEIQMRFRNLDAEAPSVQADIEWTVATDQGSRGFHLNNALHHHWSESPPEDAVKWRTVQLPILPDDQHAFEREPATTTYPRIAVNVLMIGHGAVEVRNIQLVEFLGGRLVRPGVWWSDRTAGLYGGIAGSLVGILGGAIGTLAGFKRYRIALHLMTAMTIACAAALIVGLIALIADQPYAVYYPLLLLGLIGTILPLVLQRTLRKRLQHDELRKMQSLDAA